MRYELHICLNTREGYANPSTGLNCIAQRRMSDLDLLMHMRESHRISHGRMDMTANGVRQDTNSN